MAGKRKAEDVLFDCHDWEPEVDETTVEASQKGDDDDEIISEEEYQTIMAESRTMWEKECSEMFARLGIRQGDYDENEEEDEEDDEDDDGAAFWISFCVFYRSLTKWAKFGISGIFWKTSDEMCKTKFKFLNEN